MLALALLLLALLSLTVGPVDLGAREVLTALIGNGTTEEALRERIIVRDLRLPRTLLAVLTGGSLGLAGAALQGLLRNPLAEPGLLGISSSASLGAVLSLYFGLAAISPWLLPVTAMGFAALATWTLYAIARQSSSLTLILAGIALSTLVSALTSLALNLAPNPADLQDIVLWLLGSLSQGQLSGRAALSALCAHGGRRYSLPAVRHWMHCPWGRGRRAASAWMSPVCASR